MDKHKRHGAFRQQHDFSGAVVGRANSRGGQFVAEPFFDGRFMFPRNRARRVATQIGEFNHGAREPPAGISWFPRPVAKLSEVTLDQFLARGNRSMELHQALEREFTGIFKGSRHQRVFALEVLIQCPFGDTGARGDLIHGNPEESLTPEQPVRGVENLQSRLHSRSSHRSPLGIPMSEFTSEFRCGQVNPSDADKDAIPWAGRSR